MWLPPLVKTARRVQAPTLADVLERVVGKGIIVHGDGEGSSRVMLSAVDLINADVPIVGARVRTSGPPAVPPRRARKRRR